MKLINSTFFLLLLCLFCLLNCNDNKSTNPQDPNNGDDRHFVQVKILNSAGSLALEGVEVSIDFLTDEEVAEGTFNQKRIALGKGTAAQSIGLQIKIYDAFDNLILSETPQNGYQIDPYSGIVVLTYKWDYTDNQGQAVLKGLYKVYVTITDHSTQQIMNYPPYWMIVSGVIGMTDGDGSISTPPVPVHKDIFLSKSDARGIVYHEGHFNGFIELALDKAGWTPKTETLFVSGTPMEKAIFMDPL
jgi:hypothetical protein